MQTTIANETLRLLPERALFWPRTATLLAADVHVGKGAAFRAAALPVPRGTTADDLDRLADLVQRHQARRLVVLGDLVHARTGLTPDTIAALAAWRDRLPSVEIILVRGNHDRRAGVLPADLGIACVEEPLIDGPFAFRHYPTETPGLYTLAGHVHPAARLVGPGRQKLRLPCFYFAERVGILPAFGGLTGTAVVRPRAAERVFVVAGDEVVQVS